MSGTGSRIAETRSFSYNPKAMFRSNMSLKYSAARKALCLKK
jgi:hypothetical protein